jgi:hypothetical protein
MRYYTAFEYLCIDVANQYGLDKELFETRIEWTLTRLWYLEILGDEREHWKEKPLYIKAVRALRDVQQGKPTGHMMGLDAVCSGLQLMSVLTGCKSGSTSTGLINPDKRSDAYTDVLRVMQKILPGLPDAERQSIKDAAVAAFYGSKAEPERLFGEDTPELKAFHLALYQVGPGACRLLQALLDSWQPYALEHSWVLPDNHHIHVKVMDLKTARIRIDELNSSFTYEYSENTGTKRGLSNAANVIHSIDAYVLRCLVRRCSYDLGVVNQARLAIESELLSREVYGYTNKDLDERYTSTKMADVVVLDTLNTLTVAFYSTEHLLKLQSITSQMLEHKPFDVITVHDDFKCHPNYVNHMRWHYKEILADLADSTILDDIFSNLYEKAATYPKLTEDLGNQIRLSNYSLS